MAIKLRYVSLFYISMFFQEGQQKKEYNSHLAQLISVQHFKRQEHKGKGEDIHLSPIIL